MKVAIIGAGLAGLSCAYELEKRGIKSTIFERYGFIGDSENHVSAILFVVNRPAKDPLMLLKHKYGINLKPAGTINLLTHFSQNKKTSLKGNFGYFMKRNRDNDSLKAQLYSHLKKPEIIFNEFVDYETLIGKYDYVIVATGNSNYTNELGCWQKKWISGYVRVAVLHGDFNPCELIMWINKKYCKNGYAYLTPYNSQKASLALFVPDIEPQELNQFWELFLSTENIKYKTVEEAVIMHESGFVYPHKVGNILFAGNSGGMLDPFLGFGQTKSIFSGIYAAQAIAEKKNYDELLIPFQKDLAAMYEFRKAINNSTDRAYDYLLTSLGLPGVKNVLYNLPVNFVKYGGYILGFSNKKRKF